MEIDKELEEARERLKKTHRNQKISGAPKTLEFSSEGKEEKKQAKKEEAEEENEGEIEETHRNQKISGAPTTRELSSELEPAEESFAEFEMSRSRETRAPVLAQADSEQAGGSLDSMLGPSLPAKKDDEDKVGKEEGPRYSIQQEIKKYERNEIMRAEVLTPREFAVERRFEEGMRPVQRHEEWRGGGGGRTDIIKYSSERLPEREDLPFMKKEKGNLREAKKYYGNR